MAILQWRRLIGQQHIKDVFSSAFTNDKLGHAYLLCGEAGTGTFAAALELSTALLCTSGTIRPCMECSACKKVYFYAHPDFHVVMPIALQKEHRKSDGEITEEGWEEFYARVRERIEDPYLIQEFTIQPTIPVDWVREVTHAIRRGAIEKGKNIVIFDGIDIMLKEAANALLKTLEEPPGDTLLLLCTERVHAVLPTIVSRCQILRFGALAPELIRKELVSRFSLRPDDPRLDVVVHTGSLGRARMLFEHIDTKDLQNAVEFWRLIANNDHLALWKMIDNLCEKGDYSTYENIFMHLLYGIRNGFFSKIGGAENYIIGNNFFSDIPGFLDNHYAAEKVAEFCESAISKIRARANVAMVFAGFALQVSEFINEQKQ